MAKLKANEQRLLFAFLVTLFLTVVWYTRSFYVSHRESADELSYQLSLQEAEIEVLLEERDKWTQRSEWLEAFQPNYTSRGEVQNELFKEARADGVEGVETSGIELIEQVETPDYTQAGVSFDAKGTLVDVFTWLHTLQQPETFRVIRTLRVKPNKEDPGQVECYVELLKWYRPTLTAQSTAS
ncbi:MAG: hypothetical protein ACI8UO_002598 [Verrucomicrobiales bacterium]|jgi:hypothetical protein